LAGIYCRFRLSAPGWPWQPLDLGRPAVQGRTGSCEVQSGGRSDPRWVRPNGRLPV